MWMRRFIDPQKIDVQDLAAERMHLDIAQQHLLRRSVELHRQDRGVECLVLECMLKRVVIELDGLGCPCPSVHDARRTAGPAQAAVRAAALGGSREGGEFVCHAWDSFVCGLRLEHFSAHPSSAVATIRRLKRLSWPKLT